MPKSEHSTFTTTLDATRVKGILSSVLSSATVESLNQGPLDGNAALAIVASQRGGVFNKSPFGPGNAVAQIIVEDHGSTRSVELIAVGTSFMQGMNAQRSAGDAMAGISAVRQQPNLKFGRNMVGVILQALKAADPSIRQTH